MVLLETGLEKDPESNSARRERGTCRWRRGADSVMMEVERKGRKIQTEMTDGCQGHYDNSFRDLRVRVQAWPALTGTSSFFD
jgi:hypothetical protein